MPHLATDECSQSPESVFHIPDSVFPFARNRCSRSSGIRKISYESPTAPLAEAYALRPAGAPPRRAPAAGTGVLWPRGRSSRVRPRGAPSRLPARPGVPGTTRSRVSRRSRRTSGTRVPRPPRGRPTRSHKHGPRRTPDTARGLHARRAASPPAPVAQRPGRARASRRTRAARGPWAAPTRAPEKTVSDQAQPPRGAPA